MRCPLCGTPGRRRFAAHGIPILDCPACRHRFAGLVPPPTHIDTVYADAYFNGGGAGYPDYLAAVLYSGLLAPGGTVCVDNTLLQGEPWAAPGPAGPSANGAAIAAFNASVAADPRLVQVVVPLRDGITLIRRVDDGPLSHAQQDDSTTDGRSRT